MGQRKWTHPSVVRFAGGGDPVSVGLQRARQFVLDAQDRGWDGPPYDPFDLARLQSIQVVPTQDVRDARTVSPDGTQLQIEFNPTRPLPRLRYSIAHEIAHTLFSDCAEAVRHRAAPDEMRGDEWQLEMLCNLIAAEILMPIGSFLQEDGGDSAKDLDIDRLVQLKETYGVSMEAALMRAVRLTNAQAVMFVASVKDEDSEPRRYSVDYAINSPNWQNISLKESEAPHESCLRQCTAVGFTARSTEYWPVINSELLISCVGIPPFPGRRLPRVAGLAKPTKGEDTEVGINYVKGDCLQPRGDSPHLVVQVMNNVGKRWGGGFPAAVARRWRAAEDDYRQWFASLSKRPDLGAVRFFDTQTGIHIATIVAQDGLGRNRAKRVRYNALTNGLDAVRQHATEYGMTVHMPRIGCGQAGGDWRVVSELVEDALTQFGVGTWVYDIPDAKPNPQRSLFM